MQKNLTSVLTEILEGRQGTRNSLMHSSTQLSAHASKSFQRRSTQMPVSVQSSSPQNVNSASMQAKTAPLPEKSNNITAPVAGTGTVWRISVIDAVEGSFQ